jgi:hypothetical protein
MSRPLRLEFADALYYITARGNAINLIFLQEDDSCVTLFANKPDYCKIQDLTPFMTPFILR